MLLSVSVDLDGTRFYRAIHGLGAADSDGLIFTQALPRLSDWARQRGIPLTLFVVGQDVVGSSDNAEALRRLGAAGHELGCHSYSHFYDLTRRPVAEMRREVEHGRAVLERAGGVKVTGFRAPGYIVTDTLLDLLREAEFAYDSSVFPCPSYYALKVAAIARLRARGRESRSIIDVPEVLRAPTAPYRVGRPYWFRGTGVWEIPIQVTRGPRLPFIGTALTMAGPRGARLLASAVFGAAFVNLELHAIDALDQNDGLHELAKHQRDLRIPWSRKIDAIDAAVSSLRGRGYACVRLDELAARARKGA